jgi:hypothetical protein
MSQVMTHNIELSVKPTKKFSLLLILSVVVAHKIESTSKYKIT